MYGPLGKPKLPRKQQTEAAAAVGRDREKWGLAGALHLHTERVTCILPALLNTAVLLHSKLPPPLSACSSACSSCKGLIVVARGAR